MCDVSSLGHTKCLSLHAIKLITYSPTQHTPAPAHTHFAMYATDIQIFQRVIDKSLLYYSDLTNNANTPMYVMIIYIHIYV